MIARHALLVLIPLAAACSAPLRSAPPSQTPQVAAAAADTTLFLLDGQKIARADVALIDPVAIESVSHWVGPTARARFGADTREVVEIITKKERRGPAASEATAAPLFLLDGRVMPAALLNVLDPKRIEKIDVLKGAAAAER